MGSFKMGGLFITDKKTLGITKEYLWQKRPKSRSPAISWHLPVKLINRDQ